MKQETKDRKQKTGDKKQETKHRRQETGDRRQEPGDKETGDNTRKMSVNGRKTADSRNYYQFSFQFIKKLRFQRITDEDVRLMNRDWLKIND